MGQQTDWAHSDASSGCVDTTCDDLEAKVLHIIEQCVPISIQKTTKEGIPLRKARRECPKLRSVRKERDMAWHDFDTSPTHFNVTCAFEAQEKYKSIEMRMKEKYEIKLAKRVKCDPDRFFAYLRSKKKLNKTVSSLKKEITAK